MSDLAFSARLGEPFRCFPLVDPNGKNPVSAMAVRNRRMRSISRPQCNRRWRCAFLKSPVPVGQSIFELVDLSHDAEVLLV